MQDLARLNSLIDKAAAIHGSDNQLAIALGKSRQQVSNWRNGHAAPGIDVQKQLCEIAGIDPAGHVMAAAIEKTNDPAAMALFQKLKVQSILIMRTLAGTGQGPAAAYR